MTAARCRGRSKRIARPRPAPSCLRPRPPLLLLPRDFPLNHPTAAAAAAQLTPRSSRCDVSLGSVQRRRGTSWGPHGVIRGYGFALARAPSMCSHRTLTRSARRPGAEEGELTAQEPVLGLPSSRLHGGRRWRRRRRRGSREAGALRVTFRKKTIRHSCPSLRRALLCFRPVPTALLRRSRSKTSQRPSPPSSSSSSRGHHAVRPSVSRALLGGPSLRSVSKTRRPRPPRAPALRFMMSVIGS